MRRYINLCEARRLPSGSVIRREKSFTSGHPGVISAENGQACVIHNCKDRGRVVLESLDTFCQGRQVFILSTDQGRDPLSTECEARALLARGRPYHLLANNCQHFATQVAKGPTARHSEDVAGYMVAGLAGLVLWGIFSK